MSPRTATATKPVEGTIVDRVANTPAPVSAPEAAGGGESPAAATPIATLQATQHSAQVLSLLERVMTAPDFDIDRLERLWAMQKEVHAEQAKASFIAANSRMQGEIPSIPKRGTIKNNSGGVQSHYALWEDVNTAIKPILQRHGFALSFLVNQNGAAITVTGILSHQDGHRELTDITLAPDKTGAKNDVQAIGSAVSYGKRYTASALLNITSHGEDDDGRHFGDAQASDVNMAKVADFEAAIMGALDETELRRVGDQVAGAKLPPRLHTRVRNTYGARLHQLRDEEAERRRSGSGAIV